MLIHHRELARPEETLSLQALVDQLRALWRSGDDGGLSEQRRDELALELRQLDARLELSPGVDEQELLLRVTEEAAKPLAELFAELAPLRVFVGRAGGALTEALAEVEKRCGVDLSLGRVRAGVTRGHLLQIVVSVPLDVVEPECGLQVAVEVLCEALFGDAVLDRWVLSIDADRTRRTSGLIMVADAAPALDASTYPMDELPALVRSGISAIETERSVSMLNVDEDRGWTALDIPEMDEGAQADRLQASTSCPEALKAALEGMPFDSARFTRGPEVFLWLCWRARADRSALKALAEEVLEQLAEEGLPIALAGTGFGQVHDYLDLWGVPDAAVLQRLGREMAEALSGDVELGFYDSRWEEERAIFSPSDGVPVAVELLDGD